MNVLSLFDGMSCGQIALNRCGIKYNNYYASEIDKHAIKVTQANYPNTIQLGSILNVHAKDLPKIDLIMGGSPCQGFSFAGKGLNFEDPRSKLFFEFVRLVKEVMGINPEAKFLLENVQMKKEHEIIISRYMGVNPIVINSALVSAQNRVRLYWTNINNKPFGIFGDMFTDIPQPKDKGIFLKHILETEVDEKYYLSETALARIKRKVGYQPQIDPGKTGTLNTKNNSGQLSVDNGTTLIADRGKSGEIITNKNGKSFSLSAHDGCGFDQSVVIIDVEGNKKRHQQKASCFTAGGHSGGNHSDMDLVCVTMRGRGENNEQTLEANTNGKTNSLTSVQKDNLLQIVNTSRIRRLTPLECERLQTAPDNYTNHVSDSQRYKMLGNGWNVDTICHIFSYL